MVQMQKLPERRYLSTARAAKYLGIDRKTLKTKSSLGIIPCKNLDGRRVFDVLVLDAYIAGKRNWHEDSSDSRSILSRLMSR
jgi:hypothetical protein